MKKPTFAKILIGISIGIAIAFGVLFAAGIGSLIYMSYRNPRDPIYQTEMTDFELHVQGGETAELRASMQRESQEFVEKLKIKTLRCFLFRGHTNRPIYCIVMVGGIPPDTDLPGHMQKTLPLKRNPWVLSALRLSGADVREEDLCRKWIPDPFFAGQVYVCRDRIVFYTAAANPTFLLKETDKRAFLEKYISPKKK